ncbi:hypothetical protein [Streptomyces bluensis]|uniref:Uncharacterized protein n=1 Tax=Streptomyces bluensis TaxID=33897 RepID=A0ABW6UY51_9ACTN
MTSTTATGWDALQKRLDTVQKPVATFRLCQDSDLRDRYLDAKKEADEAARYLKSLDKDADREVRTMVEKQAAAAAAALKAVQPEYEQATITLRFTALERRQLEELQSRHPASEEDEAAGQDYAMDTFAPALIAAASLDGMPEDYARKCLDTWGPGDARDLWEAAWSVQQHRRADLGKG